MIKKTLSRKNGSGNRVRVFVAGIALLAATVLSPSHAHAYITPSVKTLAVDAAFHESLGFHEAQDTNSAIRREMVKLYDRSVILHENNIEKIALEFLTSHLGDNVPVVIWDHKSGAKNPLGDTVLYLKLEYSLWPQHINGKSIVVGAIGAAAAVPQNARGNFWALRDFGSQTVESFIVSDDLAKTRNSIEAAIARLLDRYSTMHKVPDNE